MKILEDVLRAWLQLILLMVVATIYLLPVILVLTLVLYHLFTFFGAR